MPTYDYKCLKCGHSFEAFQKITDEPLKECPECRGEVKRLISPGSGIIFKGSGFYATDYKKKNQSKEKGSGCKDSSCPVQKSCPKNNEANKK